MDVHSEEALVPTMVDLEALAREITGTHEAPSRARLAGIEAAPTAQRARAAHPRAARGQAIPVTPERQGARWAEPVLVAAVGGALLLAAPALMDGGDDMAARMLLLGALVVPPALGLLLLQRRFGPRG
jgi:hypothetical protein